MTLSLNNISFLFQKHFFLFLKKSFSIFLNLYFTFIQYSFFVLIFYFVMQTYQRCTLPQDFFVPHFKDPLSLFPISKKFEKKYIQYRKSTVLFFTKIFNIFWILKILYPLPSRGLITPSPHPLPPGFSNCYMYET